MEKCAFVLICLVVSVAGLNVDECTGEGDCQDFPPPTSISSQHPAVVLEFRPDGWEEKGISRLEYFCIRGLGEVPRLMLELTQTPYDSVMHFGTKEYKNFAPLGQLPVFWGPGLGGYVAQSATIVRYIARETGLEGATSAEKAHADMIFELSKDISGKKAAVFPGAAEKDVDRLQMHLSMAERLLQQAASRVPHSFTAAPTYGDVGMFHALATLEEVAEGALDAYPLLQEFVKAFAALPAIDSYLSSPRRLPLTENEVGDQPWRPDGYTYLTPLDPAVYAKKFGPMYD